MRTFLKLIIIISVTSCSTKETRQADNSSIKDTLNGNYTETIREEGIPVKINYYTDNRLQTTDFYKNGHLFDRVQLDSVGNIKSRDPIIIWDNSDSFKKADTIILKIKNVDSLTYYQYFFTTSQIEFDLEGNEKLKTIRPLDARQVPLIKIPKSKLGGQTKMYFKWGYLVDVRDSADTRIHHWEHFDEVFEFKDK